MGKSDLPKKISFAKREKSSKRGPFLLSYSLMPPSSPSVSGEVNPLNCEVFEIRFGDF